MAVEAGLDSLKVPFSLKSPYESVISLYQNYIGGMKDGNAVGVANSCAVSKYQNY